MNLYQNRTSFSLTILFYRFVAMPLVYIQCTASFFLRPVQRWFFWDGYVIYNFLKSHLCLPYSPLLFHLNKDYCIQKPHFLQTKVYLLEKFFQQKANLTYRFFYNLCTHNTKHNFQHNLYLLLLLVLYGQYGCHQMGLSYQYKNIYHRKQNTLLFASQGYWLKLRFVPLSLSNVLKLSFIKIQNISVIAIRIFLHFVSVTECRLHPTEPTASVGFTLRLIKFKMI